MPMSKENRFSRQKRHMRMTLVIHSIYFIIIYMYGGTQRVPADSQERKISK